MNANIFKTAIAALALLVVFNSCKEETKYHIEVTCDPERGTVTGTGDYAEGEEITVTATANSGYYFVRWNGIGQRDSVAAIKVSRDISITAVFGKIESNQFGTVKVSETRIGDSIMYEALPNKDCYFVGWSNKSKMNPVILKNDADPITADFIKIDNSNNQNGFVVAVVEPNKHWTNDPYVLAVPADGYYFWKWSDGSIKEKREVPANTEVSLTAFFKPYPEGTIHSVFYVSDTKRVFFSKGYLQFNPSLGTHTRADGTTAPGTWRFAEKQTEYFKEDSVVDGATYNGWIGHFAWGTSGWSGSGATYYQPYEGKINGDVLDNPEGFYERHPNLKTDYDENQFGPQGECDLTGEYAYADWGVYNPISNGGNKPGMWRTLKYDEFKFFAEHCHSSSLPGCRWYYNGEFNISEQLIDEYRDGKYDNFYKEIDANNQIVFLYNYWGWEMWSVEGTEDGLACLSDIPYLFKRCLRFRVRLVMDVAE
ncbi:MAG: hypothetical protein J6W13_08165 [Salinivirgaceae bacterium]|nr:hypothetical protein [Salinivirgaceae bacterium]